MHYADVRFIDCTECNTVIVVPHTVSAMPRGRHGALHDLTRPHSQATGHWRYQYRTS